ncbi:MAG: LamG domain-containing protein [Pirellulaceae bacterium]
MKYFTLIAALVLLASGTVRADWNSVITADSPLHWFNFEDAGATADDLGSADADGTYAGGVTLGSAGLVGGAASFDGTGHVLVGGADLTGDWTVETIFKADTVNGGASMGIMGADFTAASRMALKAEQWNSTERLGFTVFGVVDVTTEVPTPSDYSHVAFVGTSAGVSVFVDGVESGSSDVATALSRYVLGAGAIRADGSLVDGLTGSIDELVIYDRALSAGDIAAHYAAVPEPSSVVLIGLGTLGLLAIRRRR